MRKKRYFLYFLVLVMVLSLLVGCSTGNEPAEIPGNSNESGKTGEPSGQEPVVMQASIEGNVENPLDFKLSDFPGEEITIKAEMRKCKETEPARDFKGIPLSVILNKAKPAADSTKLTIVGSDGYQKNYVLEDVLLNDVMIISEQEDGLQVIAEDSQKYDASYWVRGVVKLIIK